MLDKETNEKISKESALKEYLNHLLEQNKYMQWKCLPPVYKDQQGREVYPRIPMEAIYIQIKAVDVEKRREKENREKQRLDDARKHKSGGADLFLLDEIYSLSLKADKTREKVNPVLPQEALKENKRIMVYGGPGAGKSTLLQHLLYEYSCKFSGKYPVLVRLGEYAEYLERDPGLTVPLTPWPFFLGKFIMCE